MKVAFTILGEPCSSKNSRSIVKFGNRPALIKSPEARAYQESVILQLPEAAKVMWDCHIQATVRTYYSAWRKDADIELLYDALAAKFAKRKGKLINLGEGQYTYGSGERYVVRRGVYLNDRQVRIKLLYADVLDRVNPRVEIEFEPLQPVQGQLLAEDLAVDQTADDESEETV